MSPQKDVMISELQASVTSLKEVNEEQRIMREEKEVVEQHVSVDVVREMGGRLEECVERSAQEMNQLKIGQEQRATDLIGVITQSHSSHLSHIQNDLKLVETRSVYEHIYIFIKQGHFSNYANINLF